MDSCPKISVLVLNHNGRRHLKDCFDSLAAVDYPRESLDLVLVDNGSRDGSAGFVEKRYPQARVIRFASNLGFCAAYNRAAAQTDSPYLVFLNNDMAVEKDFLRGLLEALGSRPDAVCAGAKILSWDGSVIDFAGGAASFSGYAYQMGMGRPAGSPEYVSIRPVLFACGGAMLIDRRIFIESGGFDESYTFFFEDLDLGWRLWALGHAVVFAPGAVVRHRHHGSVRALADSRKSVLYRRNSIATALKNSEDRHAGGILSAILLGTVAGTVDSAARRGALDPAAFDIFRKGSGAGGARFSATETASLVALARLSRDLPDLLRKRKWVQENRKRSDEEIAALVAWPFRHWPGVPAETKLRIADTFHVQEIYQSVPRTVVVVSSDILPLPGYPTVGSGLRAWGLGQGLIARGHRVLFAMPKAAARGREMPEEYGIRDLAWDTRSLNGILHEVAPDCVLVCNWPVMDVIARGPLEMPLLLDQHGPHFLEREFQRFGVPAENAFRKRRAMAKADFFTCAGNRQARYFRRWLREAGWTEEEVESRTAVIPVSMSPDLPAREPEDGATFVYGGVFLPWQDPTRVLDLLTRELADRPDARLKFFGGRHPVYDVDSGVYAGLEARLRACPQVRMMGFVPHDALLAEYRNARAAVDVMKRNAERELAFTTRTVEYLWCGLPVIHHDYAELSELIRRYDAGWTVDPEDDGAIRAALREALEDPARAREKSANAQRLVRERLTWDRTIEPLDAEIRRPRMRAHTQQEDAGDRLRFLASRGIEAFRRGGLRSVLEKGLRLARRTLRGDA